MLFFISGSPDYVALAQPDVTWIGKMVGLVVNRYRFTIELGRIADSIRDNFDNTFLAINWVAFGDLEVDPLNPRVTHLLVQQPMDYPSSSLAIGVLMPGERINIRDDFAPFFGAERLADGRWKINGIQTL